jgi:hypothetical protein
MNQFITINQTELTVKEYLGQRVVTLKEIDAVHNRPDGTARRNFNTNKNHLIEGTDYFVRNSSEAISEFDITAPNGLTLITESGYLMLVKSFTDDLAWEVQRKLVNSYFRVQNIQEKISNLSPQLQLLINIELQQKQQATALEATNKRIDEIGDVISLDTTSWRKDAKTLIVRIAQKMGGNQFIEDVQREIFQLIDKRGSVSLATRQTNKRQRMASEGVCKSTRDRVTKTDIIADDKKLIEIYVAIVKEMAVKYGVGRTA